MNMDDIPLPDDIPVPQEGEVSSAHLDTTIPELTLDTTEENEHHNIIENVVEDETNKRFFNVDTSVSCANESVPDTNCSVLGIDTSATDISTSSPKNEMYSPGDSTVGPDENISTLEVPESLTDVTEQQENRDNKVHSEDSADDQYSFSERHELLTSRADVPVPGESEHEFYMEENQDYSLNDQSASEESKQSNAEIPLPVTDTYPPQPPESGAPPEPSYLVDNSTNLQNNQVQYSTTNYMAYPTHMADPSMMSHNYSYMTAPSNYSDYLSMYHAAGRMPPRPYPNAYASYQGYNYAYPMQQMYDGRNMAAYTPGNYPTQMLPPTPPLPPGQPAPPQLNTFNPPLPSDYSATSFPSKESVSRTTKTDNQQQLQVEPDQSKLNIEKDTPSLPKGTASEEQLSNDIVEDQNLEEYDPAFAPSAESETETGKLTTSEQSNIVVENHVLSEDVNRYSPSLPMDEDDTNNQSESAESALQIRPPQKTSSVLGKAQAKKRLMAFSISKQAAAAHIAAKKQAQELASSSNLSSSNSVTGKSVNKKENGDVSVDETNNLSIENADVRNVFEDKHQKKKLKKSGQKERARETIEEIEEIKRTEMLMRDSSLMYRQSLLNDLSDSQKRSSDSRKRSHSRSRRSRSRSRDRKSKRRSKKYRRRSRSRSGSQSRSGSRHRDKKSKVKTSEIKSWTEFAEAGFQLDRYRRVKFNENKNFLESEVERRKKEESKHRHRRSRSQDRKSISIEKEVVEECRKKKVNFLQMPMEIKQPVVCVRAGPAEEVVEYPSRIIQYTNTRPILKYCENPSRATCHLISREELLETVPDDIAVLIKQFWNSVKLKRLKNKEIQGNNANNENESGDIIDNRESKTIKWWSASPLHEENVAFYDSDVEEDREDAVKDDTAFVSSDNVSNSIAESVPVKTLERASGVRKSRFEEVVDDKQDVSVVVRSRWDSDYEESPEKMLDNKVSKNEENCFHFSQENSLPKVAEAPEVMAGEKEEKEAETSYLHDNDFEIDVADENTDEKKCDSIEKHSKRRRDKRKHDEKNKNHEYKKAKSKFESPEQWQEEQPDWESETQFEMNEVYDKKYEMCWKQPEEEPVGEKSGDHKLVSEYEQFLKMVSSEPPNKDNEMPLYEGPKPPPRWNQKSNDKSPMKDDEKLNVKEHNSASEDEKNDVHIDQEEEFDVDKFFMKEKEKKLKKMNLLNSAMESDTEKNTDDVNFISEGQNLDVHNSEKKRDRKDKKKKKASLKLKKKFLKNKKKRKNEKKKKKKKKHNVSSDSSSDSSDTDSDDSNSSGNSGSSSSSSSSSSSTTSSSSSSSSNDDSSSSSPKRKRKRSKKTTKKDKKRERKLSDKHKKKKKRQKSRDSDSDNKKKRKKKNEEDKRNKSKKLPADNFLELIEKSLAVTLKKSENEESPTIKKLVKEKQRKRKKKSERGKKEKAKILDLIAPNLPEDVRSNLIDDGGESEGKSSEKSSSDFKKKKKKDKNRRNSDFANEETPGWKKKKIDPKEIEENVMKVQQSFLDESMDISDWKLSEKWAAELNKKKQKRKKDSDELPEDIPVWKNKKIDPKEIEESVIKAQVGSFFDENLDDWDSITTAMPVVKHSMRDDLKNVTTSDSAEKKRKRKKKEAKRKHDKHVKETKQRTEKNKVEKRKLKLRYKRKPKKHRKRDDIKPCTDEDLNNSIALENIPIPEDKAPSPDTPVERNFAMFSSEEKKRSENEAAEREIPSNSFGQNLFNNEQESVDNSQNSTLDSRQSYEPPVTNVLERYSPTTEYEVDEDETTASQISKDVSYSGISNEEASTNTTIISVNNNNPASGLFPCFTKPTMHAIPFSPAVVPVPVPPPSPVPPPVPVPPPMNQSNIASVNDSTLTKAKVTSPLSTVAIQGTMTIAPTPVKHFSQFINQESSEQDVACKSFSIGKLEVRTKAARKFVHSNIFDSFDVEEHANLEAPSQTKISEPVESAKVVETPSPEELPPSPMVPEEEREKEVFQVRECIALPEIPSDDVRTTSRGARTPSPRPENIDPLIVPEAEEQRPKDNSVSSDRNSKKDRHNKDASHSHDTYRSRRSRSRTRSRSRDNRYKKRYRKDRYKRRSRSRSTSRNRRRSKDRDSRDHRYRSKRRSFSVERNMDRRRSQSGERALKRPEPPISRSDHNSFGMDNTVAIGSSHWEREERRHYDDYYDRRSRERSTESAKMAVISEITRSVREMEGTSKKEISNTDFKILQTNLCQLKETLQNLNKQGVQLDALHNVLSVLENTNIHIQSRDNEAVRRDACWQRENTQSSPSSDRENADQKSESNVDFQKIISLCQAIQSTLPDTPSKDDKTARSSTRSPQAAGKSNVTLKTKKSVADSTNSGFSQSNKRFEMRSREISPKPLSLDERLELELGVKRAAPPSIPPAQSASMNMPRPPFYQVPVFENVPNFSTPPPPIPSFPPPMMNCNPELGYYPSRPPLNWNTAEAFVGQNVPKIPQPVVMMPPHRMPPPRVIQPPSEPPPSVNSLQNKPYRVSDPAGNKVHSIQIGNVLQIVPTEVQPASSSSQPKIPALPQVSLATSNMPVPPNSQHVNTLSSSGHVQNVTGLSSILSAHLPGSFAAAPAVSGSKSNTIVPRVSESSPVKEPRLAPNDPRQKPKDLAPPLPSTSDEEMKKLMRLTKEKRKEEKVLQHLLKAKGMRGSPATPNSDDSSLADDTTDGNEDSYTAVSIKPSPEQGILISPGFKDKSTPVTQLGRSIIGSSRKMVSFVDGIRPGAVTGEDTAPTRIRRPSPPPSPVSTVPQKKKHKVRVKIIRPDESDDDDTPPPPPPGPPPPDLYPPVMSTLGVLPPGFMLPKI